MAVRPSSRQSVAAGSLSRKSIAPGSMGLGHASTAVIQYDENGNVLLSAAQQRVKDKQRESEGFTKLKRQTEQQQQYVDSLTDKTNLLAEGSDGKAFKCNACDVAKCGIDLTNPFGL
jgi:hypothetical protein